MKNIRPNGLSRAIGNFLEYVRRSMTLRNQKSAYVSMRKVGAECVKPGGTAGILSPVPAFWDRSFLFCYP